MKRKEKIQKKVKHKIVASNVFMLDIYVYRKNGLL